MPCLASGTTVLYLLTPVLGGTFSLTHTHTGKRAGGWVLRLEQTGDDDDDDDGQQFSKEGREVIKVGLIIGPSS